MVQAIACTIPFIAGATSSRRSLTRGSRASRRGRVSWSKGTESCRCPLPRMCPASKRHSSRLWLMAQFGRRIPMEIDVRKADVLALDARWLLNRSEARESYRLAVEGLQTETSLRGPPRLPARICSILALATAPPKKIQQTGDPRPLQAPTLTAVNLRCRGSRMLDEVSTKGECHHGTTNRPVLRGLASQADGHR